MRLLETWIKLDLFCSSRPFQTGGLGAIMQHDPTRTPPVFLLCRRRASLISTCDKPPNFAETLPTEMTVRIFGELDAGSLCSASRTCKLWHDIIEDSEQLWRRQCLLVRAVCEREVDSDRRSGLSWKVGPRRRSTQNQTRCESPNIVPIRLYRRKIESAKANKHLFQMRNTDCSVRQLVGRYVLV